MQNPECLSIGYNKCPFSKQRMDLHEIICQHLRVACTDRFSVIDYSRVHCLNGADGCWKVAVQVLWIAKVLVVE